MDWKKLRVPTSLEHAFFGRTSRFLAEQEGEKIIINFPKQ
jgi:hypothetical protein